MLASFRNIRHHGDYPGFPSVSWGRYTLAHGRRTFASSGFSFGRETIGQSFINSVEPYSNKSTTVECRFVGPTPEKRTCDLGPIDDDGVGQETHSCAVLTWVDSQ